MKTQSLPERLAEYFVICGLPKNPSTYDVSKILTHAEEIIAPNTSIDFTRFPEPIVDIKIVSLREKEEIPEGYTCIKYSVSGKHKANILLNFGEEACICYRRGRDQPFIRDIDTLGEKQCPKTNAVVLSRTIGGRAADLPSSLTNRLFLSYLRGTVESSIDCLAVTDLCIIIPEKQESCPPAYRQVTEPICISSFRLKAYICYRKSLVKQCIISYKPEVLYWYRVPSVDYNCSNPSINNKTPQYSSVVPNNPSSDPPEMCDQLNKGMDDKTCSDFSPESQVAPLDPDIFQVANFCLPWGASIESWSVNQDPPEVNSFTFMLTNEAYQKLYGVALTFYEPYVEQLDLHKCYCLGVDPELIYSKSSTDLVNDEYDANEEAIAKRQRHFLASRVGDRILGVTKTLCILSRWSFTLPFSNFLGFLYSRCLLSNNLDNIPFERYLGYFLFEIPFPDRAIPSISVDLCAAPILIQRPDDTNASSSSCESFFRLLDNLSVDLIIQLLVQLLTEQKILMSSVRHSVLSDIGEALIYMIFPLKWTVVYIPYIYMGCIHVIQSPSPYLIGMDSRFFDFFRLPPNGGIAYLDLDTNNFKPPLAPGQPVFDSKVLPKKPLKQLKTRLLELKEKIFQMKNTRIASSKTMPRNMMLDCMFSTSNSELAQEELIKVRKRTQIGSCIKEAFLQFMVHLLKDYRLCLESVRNSQTDVMFNIEHFLRECADKHTIPFYRALFETQQWNNFVRDRIYASSRDEELDYFDNRIELLLESESKSRPHPHQHLHRSRNNISLTTMSNIFTIKRSASSSHEQLSSTNNHNSNSSSNNHLSYVDHNNHSEDRSVSSNASIKDKSDESTDSQVSSDLGLLPNNNNLSITVISPPCWPVPEFVDTPQLQHLLWTREYSLGFFPTNINSELLDLLASRAFLLKATLSNNSIITPMLSGNDNPDNSNLITTLITSVSGEVKNKENWMSSNSTTCTDMLLSPSPVNCWSKSPVITNILDHNPDSRRTTGMSILMMKKLQLNTPQRFGSLMLVNSPSPLIIRSNRPENTSLIGLSTKYCLPVNNATILKRTSQELRYTLNYCSSIAQTDDYSKVKYLAGSAYSIWFMLLPGYLSSVYKYYTDEMDNINHCVNKLSNPLIGSNNNDNDNNNNNNNHSTYFEVINIIKQIIVQSLGVYNRIHDYELEVPDQVALRILLVLLYQNRIEGFDLLKFINSMDWSSSSSGIANHIYKAFEKELREHERLENERSMSTFKHHNHRRSASADTELNPSTQINSSENTTGIIVPQPFNSSDDLTDQGYSTLNIHEDKTSSDQDWSPVVDQSTNINNDSMSCVVSTVDNHRIPMEQHQQIQELTECHQALSVIGSGDDTLCHHSSQSKEHLTSCSSNTISQFIPSSSINDHQTSSLSNVEQSDPTTVIGNDDNNVKNVRENTPSKEGNHINAPDTAKSSSASADVINDHNNDSSSSNGTNLSDDDSCADDDEDSENEHIPYGYNLLSSALSKIKRPFLQHYNTSPATTTTTTTHTPSSYGCTPYSHHSSIDITRDSKHLLFSKSSRQSFDDNSSSVNIMRQSAHHHDIMTTTSTTTPIAVATSNGNSNLTASLVDNNIDGDDDDDVEDNDEDNEDANAQPKVSVVHNALNFFNRSTSDFINRINMNRSLLDWRSLIPSLSTNPTPQTGRRATTSNCFTSSNLTNQHGGYHVQQQNYYYPIPPPYQPQSERISRVSWSKSSCIGMNNNTDSTYNQSTDNIPFTNTHKLSDSVYLTNPINGILLNMNYHSFDNYNMNSNGNHQLIRQFPQVNNASNSVLSNNYEREYHSSANQVDVSNSLKDMWINVAGPLLVGDVNRRISPANTRTIHLQQCLYQQYMYNSSSPSPVPAPSFHINQIESSHVIPTLNNAYHELTTTKHDNSTTSIPVTVATITASNLDSQQSNSNPDDHHSNPVVSDSCLFSTIKTPTVQSPSPCLSQGDNNNNNNNKESSPSFSSTSTTISDGNQLPNINRNNNNNSITHLNVFITTCSTCPKCKHYVYDEEIMAGWSTDENDHRTFCPFCKTYFIPQLSIRIFGDTCGGVGYNQSAKLQQRQQSREKQFPTTFSQLSNNLSNLQCDRNDSTESVQSKLCTSVPVQNTSMGLMEMTFSYLSPFVIRKSLETIIQNEGDECLHCQSVQLSLLHRHTQLTWNLVWLMYRLGLPTYLLDLLPIWIMNYQLEQRIKFKTNPLHTTHHHHHCSQQCNCNNNKQIHSNHSIIFTDALYQVHLSPNLPVYISLRWNATHPVRSVMRNSLYKYWSNFRNSDQNSPWSLVRIPSSQDTVNSNGNSCCPIHATIDQLINAIKYDNMRFALEYLIQIRAHLQFNTSLPLTITQSCTTFSSQSLPPPSSSSTSSSSSPLTSIGTTTIPSSIQTQISSEINKNQLDSNNTNHIQLQSTIETGNIKMRRNKLNQPIRCGSIECYTACLENSLYRELLFLIVQALSRTSLDLMSFDEKYDLVYRSFRNSGCTLLTDFDQPPTLIASICRQILRPLILRP
uniref:IPR001194 DENN,domain-containing protein n=1 Tax=Schistosoma mansoni TaxID=6183 RepID=A0A3Q0KKV4_SCHMA